MNTSSQVKYLGDFIHENGRPKSTISERVNRGYAIVGQIFALLSDLPLGSLRLQLGLELRQAWLLNGILFNSEVWHSVDNKDIEQFVEIDKYLLRGLTEAHAKTPVEHLYLETAALPVPFIISARRMIYLQTILQRSDNELIKQVYTCQKNSPSPGNWCTLVKGDFEAIGVEINEAQIASTSPQDFKKFIKEKVRNSAFMYLEEIKSGHSKVRENKYCSFQKPQQYLTSKLFSDKQCALIFALKSKTVRGKKDNFRNMYSDNTLCPICEQSIDSQNHVVQCKVLQDIIPLTNQVNLSDIEESLEQQKGFIQIYEKYLALRDELLEESQLHSSLPGLYTGPLLPMAGSKGATARRGNGDIICANVSLGT